MKNEISLMLCPIQEREARASAWISNLLQPLPAKDLLVEILKKMVFLAHAHMKAIPEVCCIPNLTIYAPQGSVSRRLLPQGLLYSTTSSIAVAVVRKGIAVDSKGRPCVRGGPCICAGQAAPADARVARYLKPLLVGAAVRSGRVACAALIATPEAQPCASPPTRGISLPAASWSRLKSALLSCA